MSSQGILQQEERTIGSNASNDTTSQLGYNLSRSQRSPTQQAVDSSSLQSQHQLQHQLDPNISQKPAAAEEIQETNSAYASNPGSRAPSYRYKKLLNGQIQAHPDITLTLLNDKNDLFYWNQKDQIILYTGNEMMLLTMIIDAEKGNDRKHMEILMNGSQKIQHVAKKTVCQHLISPVLPSGQHGVSAVASSSQKKHWAEESLPSSHPRIGQSQFVIIRLRERCQDSPEKEPEYRVITNMSPASVKRHQESHQATAARAPLRKSSSFRLSSPLSPSTQPADQSFSPSQHLNRTTSLPNFSSSPKKSAWRVIREFLIIIIPSDVPSVFHANRSSSSILSMPASATPSVDEVPRIPPQPSSLHSASPAEELDFREFVSEKHSLDLSSRKGSHTNKVDSHCATEEILPSILSSEDAASDTHMNQEQQLMNEVEEPQESSTAPQSIHCYKSPVASESSEVEVPSSSPVNTTNNTTSPASPLDNSFVSPTPSASSYTRSEASSNRPPSIEPPQSMQFISRISSPFSIFKRAQRAKMLAKEQKDVAVMASPVAASLQRSNSKSSRKSQYSASVSHMDQFLQETKSIQCDVHENQIVSPLLEETLSTVSTYSDNSVTLSNDSIHHQTRNPFSHFANHLPPLIKSRTTNQLVQVSIGDVPKSTLYRNSSLQHLVKHIEAEERARRRRKRPSNKPSTQAPNHRRTHAPISPQVHTTASPARTPKRATLHHFSSFLLEDPESHATDFPSQSTSNKKKSSPKSQTVSLHSCQTAPARMVNRASHFASMMELLDNDSIVDSLSAVDGDHGTMESTTGSEFASVRNTIGSDTHPSPSKQKLKCDSPKPSEYEEVSDLEPEPEPMPKELAPIPEPVKLQKEPIVNQQPVLHSPDEHLQATPSIANETHASPVPKPEINIESRADPPASYDTPTQSPATNRSNTESLPHTHAISLKKLEKESIGVDVTAMKRIAKEEPDVKNMPTLASNQELDTPGSPVQSATAQPESNMKNTVSGIETKSEHSQGVSKSEFQQSNTSLEENRQWEKRFTVSWHSCHDESTEAHSLMTNDDQKSISSRVQQQNTTEAHHPANEIATSTADKQSQNSAYEKHKLGSKSPPMISVEHSLHSPQPSIFSPIREKEELPKECIEQDELQKQKLEEKQQWIRSKLSIGENCHLEHDAHSEILSELDIGDSQSALQYSNLLKSLHHASPNSDNKNHHANTTPGVLADSLTISEGNTIYDRVSSSEQHHGKRRKRRDASHHGRKKKMKSRGHEGNSYLNIYRKRSVLRQTDEVRK